MPEPTSSGSGSGSGSGPGSGSTANDQILDRRAWRWIITACLVGAALRIAVLVTKWDRGLALNDSLYYSSQARQNAQGRWFRDVLGGHPGAEHAPLTSVLLTPSSLLPRYEFWQRATNTVLGIATIVLIAMLTWRVAGRRAAVLAAFVAALYPNLWMNDALIMSETISTATVVIALWCALRYVERTTWSSAVVCGLAAGIAALARSEVILLAPMFAIVGLWRQRKGADEAPLPRLIGRAAAVVGSALVMLIPWTVYNLGRFDAPVLVSTNAGGALLGANCDDAYSGGSLGGWSWICLLESGEREGEDAAERSQRWQREAVSYARANKGRVPVVVAARLLRTADLYGLDALVRFDVGEERMRWASWAGIVGWWVLAPFACVGWLRRLRGHRWMVVCSASSVAITVVVFYGGHRLRSPLEPVVVVGAAAAMTHLAFVRHTIDRVLARSLR